MHNERPDPDFLTPIFHDSLLRGCRKKHKSLEPRSTRRTQRKRKALLNALRVLCGSLLFRDFCDAHLRGNPNSRHGSVDKKWVSFSLSIKPIADQPDNHPLLRQLQTLLDNGEAQAIIAAMQINACIMIDEKKGRKESRKRVLKVIGSLTLLLQAIRHNLIGPLKPITDDLRQNGIRYSDSVIHELLKLEATLLRAR